MTATNEPYEIHRGSIMQGRRYVVLLDAAATEEEKRLILAALNGGRLGCGCDHKTHWCILCEPGAVS